MKKNYIIPFNETRCVITPKLDEQSNERKFELLTIDGVGMLVEHRLNRDVTPTDVRLHLIGSKEYKFFCQADNVMDALGQFYKLESCNVGYKHKAWEIADTKHNPVIEYIGCQYMKITGSYTCTQFDDEFTESNSSMFCILSGLSDPHDSCPIKQQQEKDFETKKIGGIWIKQYKD